MAFTLAPGRSRSAELEVVYLQLGLAEEAISRWDELAGVLPATDPDHWWAVGRSAELEEDWAEAARGYGQGARYWAEGKAAVDGECAINTSGGLIAKGHPIGATGIAMVGWSAWQLLGKVPAELTVKDPGIAATFNIGGPICASVCTVLKTAS